MSHCLIVTPEIRELARKLAGETPESTKTLVELWQQENQKSIDEYPDAKTLNEFRTKKRHPEQVVISEAFSSKVSSVQEQNEVDRVFDPQVRRDRASLLARLFTDQWDAATAEYLKALDERIETAPNAVVRQELQQQRDTTDRFKVMSIYTPAGIFNRVKAMFQEAVDSFQEEGASAEDLYRNQEFKKLLRYFRPLAEEASTMFRDIRIDPNYMVPAELNTSEGDEDGNPNQDDDNSFAKEESYKDGWMSKFRQASVYESLSQEVRYVIEHTPRLDYEGYIEEDDLGFTRYMDGDYVHAVLLDKLMNMVDSTDMIPLLQKLAETKPWVSQIIETLTEQPEDAEAENPLKVKLEKEALFSKFYRDLRKDYTPYWIQKVRTAPDGTRKVETVALNKPEGIAYLLESWRDNYETGTILDEDSLYTKTGEVVKDNADKGLAIVRELNNQFANLTTDERLALLDNPDVWTKLLKVLKMVGIDANPSTLRTALTNIQQTPGVNITDPIMLMLPQLDIIFSGVKKGQVKSETRVDGSVKRGDLLNTFGGAYSSIARMMAEVTNDATESSVRENDKSYYSHTNPNYMGKLLKLFKNVRGDKARFEQFIQDEFKQYDWFYKDGAWLSDWVERLATDPKMREALDFKVLLNSDKVEYQDWDNLDYTLVLLNEFWAEKPDTGMAWYHVPILSDAQSAEFIRFVRYRNGSELDADGNPMTYKQSILKHMVDLVMQEYNRINLVIQRDAMYSAGTATHQPIANFDIIRKKDGSIKSMGGAEFKFLPALNTYKVGGKSFLEVMNELRQTSGNDLRNFISGALENIMDTQFEAYYKDLYDMGLLEELPNGKFKYLPFQGQSTQDARTLKSLREAKEVLGSFSEGAEALIVSYVNGTPVNDKVATQIMESIKAELAAKVTAGELNAQRAEAISRNLIVKNNAKEALREYYWNSKHATSQIIELTTTDLAFYKNMEDFQKRYKEVHAPSLRMNTRATFNGEPVGKQMERTIYLKDHEIVSKSLEDIKEVLNSKVSKGELSATKRDEILRAFSEVNVADAQAYRSLDSYRTMMVMSGEWTQDMEDAYTHFRDGQWSAKDFDTIWQIKKPYVYTQVAEDTGTGLKMKVPVQHKNSEFPLLAMYDLIAGSIGGPSKMRAIAKWMTTRGVDVVQFESTVKVGKQGVVDINSIENEEDVITYLDNVTGYKSGDVNPDIVHEVSYEDYGIQTQTPEHGIDHEQLVGTQIRKLITADIADGVEFKINGKTLTKDQWLKLYNEVITENIIESFGKVQRFFGDPKELEAVLLDEVRGNPRYGQEMVRACTLDENGQFNIPLFDPIQSQRIQTLLDSIIKSRITKQKIKGGALIQVSSYGLSQDLNIVWEGEGDQKHIKYLECMMPAYSREFYEPLMTKDDKGNYYLDVEKLPDDLRKLIGYRVPTEDKYSMAPLYIKGFTPQQNGSAIMLPAEITTLSGSDFDVDKMYIMLPEFRVQRYDMQKAKYYYSKENQSAEKKLMDAIFGEEDEASLMDWIEASVANGDPYGLALERPRISKVRYNMNKSAKENSLEARNNMLIDMMWSVLTHPDTASKIVNPGGFDDQKAAARAMTILSTVKESELLQSLKEAGVTLKAGDNVAAYILQLPLKSNNDNVLTLSKLADKLKSKIDPLSPRTQVMFHQQNMTGAKLIGIYANHNANHALMQHTELGLDQKNGAFILNGKVLTSLHGVMNEAKQFISRNNAGFLAASVDNVKDPVLAALNQNTFTADASMLLSRLGYSPMEIGLLMNQPIVLDLTRTYFRESRSGKNEDAVFNEVINRWKERAGLTADITYENYRNNEFLASDLAEYILVGKEVGDNPRGSSDYRKVTFAAKQVSVGFLFQRILKTADALSKLVRATRADTQNGAAGPTIADTINKVAMLGDFLEESKGKKFPLVGVDVIQDLSYEGEADLAKVREDMMGSKLPFLQAFYSLGLKQTQELLKPYFPQFTEGFQDVIDTLKGMAKNGRLDVKTMNSVYNDLVAYIMSGTEFFGAGTSNGQTITSADRRAEFINNFPSYFNRVVSENEDIAELEFIKRLRVIKANDRNPVDTIVFKNVGRLSSTLKERFMRDWASLLNSENPAAQQLALNLFRYSFYRNGFAFGPNSFIHLAPIAVRQAVPEYISTLRNLLQMSSDPKAYTDFVHQYIYNHLDNRRLVPQVPDGGDTKFVDENGNVASQVQFTIGPASTFADKAVVREMLGDEYEFFEYISKWVKGENIYYRLTKDPTRESNVAVYQRIQPLGYRNSFLEYEYGKSAEEIQSVIVDKKALDVDDIAAMSDSNIDAPMPDIPAFDADAVAQYLNSEAYQQVYGTPIEDYQEAGFTTIQPNESYKDADDKTICSL